MADRPQHLAPGTPLGEHYTIEGLVRLAEGRMFYLANDVRPDQPTRKCWVCGAPDNLRSQKSCTACGTTFKDKRFLVSARWRQEFLEPAERFAKLGLKHPGISAPIDAIRQGNVLFCVVPYAGEGLMLDEAAPLSNERLLKLGQRISGLLAFLYARGVRVEGVTRANLLVSPDGTTRLFDLEILAVHDGPVPTSYWGEALPPVGELLRRYCDIESEPLMNLLLNVEAGSARSPAELGRALEGEFDKWAPVIYRPLLAGMSDVGLTRQLNEDNWGWIRLTDRIKLYVVADGMGGHDSGEVASMLAVQTLCKVAKARADLDQLSLDALENLLDESFQKANNTIKETAESKGTDMGTTMVCILIIDNKVGFMANVGDSRGYLFRGKTLHQVSKDHSLVQKMVERGRITADEARNHPHSNILLRTVGTERDIDIDIFRVELEPGDKIMMCSDGLWGEVEDRDMENLLTTYPDPRIAARELVRASHHGGGKDNVTLMVVQVP